MIPFVITIIFKLIDKFVINKSGIRIQVFLGWNVFLFSFFALVPGEVNNFNKNRELLNK